MQSSDDSERRSRRPGLSEAARWYEANAARLVGQYESVSPEALHHWLVPYLPKATSRVLDVGAGTGRDAAWLSSLGHNVVAVEPSGALRSEAQRLHPSASIQWIDDGLPGLDKVQRLGLSFDLILMSAVWMHIPPAERDRAFRKLITLLEPGGAIALTLRHGPAESCRGMYDVTLSEIERLAASHGAFIQKAEASEDVLGRGAVNWTQVVVRLPDDGTGALPLLRHIILNDDKSSTYKLALLRVLSRIADGSAGLARNTESGHVTLPLGLVGLYWIRLFKPLLAADLPQTPTNKGLDALGFVRDGFRALAEVSHLELRVGVQFTKTAKALHASIRDACRTIAAMPATYITYPNGSRVFPTATIGARHKPSSIVLDEAYLSSFGEMLVPEHLWRALQRFDVWIEPALIAEWSRLIRTYALSQGRQIEEAAMAIAMLWSDPLRVVHQARARATATLEKRPLFCVWSGKSLSASTLDIDHCIPWSSWPSDDLWNLLPADRQVNQRQKREKLPSLPLLRAAENRIKDWWDCGYGTGADEALRARFSIEARASLPIIRQDHVTLDDVFDAVTLLQVRLTHDQQIPIWAPLGPV